MKRLNWKQRLSLWFLSTVILIAATGWLPLCFWMNGETANVYDMVRALPLVFLGGFWPLLFIAPFILTGWVIEMIIAHVIEKRETKAEQKH